MRIVCDRMHAGVRGAMNRSAFLAVYSNANAWCWWLLVGPFFVEIFLKMRKAP